MTVREILHRLVDVLPDSEIPTAARVLEALVAHPDPVALATALAPDDDEPLTESDRVALSERAQTDVGAYVPLATVMGGLADGSESADRAR